MSERIVLTGISSRAWAHPDDVGATRALRRVRGFDLALRKLSQLVGERTIRRMLLGSAARAGTRQHRDLFRVYTQAATVLDVTDLPELYVRAGADLTCQAVGVERPMVVVSSALVDALDDDELRFLLGNGLGHAASGHAVYHTMLLLDASLSSLASPIPLGTVGLRAISAALAEWAHTAELSADRAGLLAAQDPAAALRAHMKLTTGGARIDHLDEEAFLEQADEYRAADDDTRDLVLRALLLDGQAFAVERAGELRRWVTAGDYEAYLAGGYPLRADDATAAEPPEADAVAASYQDRFAAADEAVRSQLGGLGRWMGDRLRPDARRGGQGTDDAGASPW